MNEKKNDKSVFWIKIILLSVFLLFCLYNIGEGHGFGLIDEPGDIHMIFVCTLLTIALIIGIIRSERKK